MLSPVMRILISKLGIGWALRILGLWNLAVGIPVSFVVKKRDGMFIAGEGQRGRTRLPMSVAKRGAYIWQVGRNFCEATAPLSDTSVQAIGAFLQAGGNVVPTYFLTTYSVAVLGYSPGTASLLLAISNAVNSVARVSMGVLADRAGRQNTMVISVSRLRTPSNLRTQRILCR